MKMKLEKNSKCYLIAKRLYFFKQAFFYWIINHFVAVCPCERLRVYLYKKILHINIGNDTHLSMNIFITGSHNGCRISIGDNTVIGAGSIVTKDIPANVVAVGNPCRVMRAINEHDKEYYYKDRKIVLNK